MSGGKLWGLFQTKDVILAKSKNWANFFPEFSLTFPSSLSKLLHSSRSEKNIVEKILFFWKKLIFCRSFQTYYQKFQDLLPFLFTWVLKRASSMSRRTLPGTLDFLLKNFYLTHFPESARTTIGILTIFFQWGRQNCGHGVQNTFPRKNFLKKFLKFSIRLWGRLFETPGENFAAGFSKLQFSCHEGSLKQKNFLFKTFRQVFCEFEQSNFWTFSKFFPKSFVDLTFSVSRLAFWEKVFMIS